MQALCDANLVLALVYERHTHHRQAILWLDTRRAREAILCRMVQLALLRLLTNSTVMQEDTCNHHRAWQIWDTLLTDERFLFLEEPGNIGNYFRFYTRADTSSPKLWQDAYLAAFSRSAAIQIATFDRGFQRFADLSLILLR